MTRPLIKIYSGEIIYNEMVVTVNDSLLPLRLDLRNHSPTGFAWGYGGSGPSQLALAILADYLRDDHTALTLYMDFKWAVITRLPERKVWTLTGVQIDKALHQLTKLLTINPRPC
jgi:hypothetical protein